MDSKSVFGILIVLFVVGAFVVSSSTVDVPLCSDISRVIYNGSDYICLKSYSAYYETSSEQVIPNFLATYINFSLLNHNIGNISFDNQTYIVPEDAFYIVSYALFWDYNPNGHRTSNLMASGTPILRCNTPADSSYIFSPVTNVCQTQKFLFANTTLSVFVLQNTGSDLNVTGGYFSLLRI